MTIPSWLLDLAIVVNTAVKIVIDRAQTMLCFGAPLHWSADWPSLDLPVLEATLVLAHLSGCKFEKKLHRT